MAEVITTVAGARSRRAAEPGAVALVPTMGALHAGHLALVRAATRLADRVWVSVFVNPAQFGPGEDYQQYPRELERDVQRCREAGAHVVFAPAAEEMYPPAGPDAELPGLRIEAPGLTDILEGRERPGHFSGVMRVVTKLFAITRPDVAVFGQKDYQQLRVIEAMTRDLSLGVRIVAHPTVREDDGLAMSSRNRYLDAAQRGRALELVGSLRLARRMAEGGETDPAAIESAMRAHLESHGLGVGYAVVRQGQTLAPLRRLEPGAVALVAARLGAVRLIDNMVLVEAREPGASAPAGV